MPRGAFSLPRQWEDWLTVVLGIWLCASPWVLQYASDDIVATQNAFLLGFLLILAETVIIAAFRPWEEWINVVLGAWLVVSPWALGIAASVATTNFVIVGLVILGLALYEMWDVRHHTVHPA